MAPPKGFNKVAHRYESFTRVEVTIWHTHRGGQFNDEPRFILEVDGKQHPVLTVGQLQTLKDCRGNDLDLTKPGSLR